MVSQTQKSITTLISRTIVNSLQSSQQTININQSVYGKCDKEVAKNLIKQRTDCIMTITDSPKNYSVEDTLDICSSFNSICSMTDVNLSSVINIDTINIQDSSVKKTINNNVNNSLSQLSSGKEDTDAIISSVSKQVNESLSTILSSLKQQKETIQTVNVNNYSINCLSLDNSVNIISKAIQSDKQLSTQIANLSNIISQYSVDSSALYKNMLYISGVFLFCFCLISIIMILKRSKSNYDFWTKALPYIIWLIFCATVTLIIIEAKPSFVMDEKNKDNFDYKKLVIWLVLVFYIAIALIIILLKKLFF